MAEKSTRASSGKQKETISEKSTPEKEDAFSVKVKEVILESKTKREREEESSEEIGKRTKVFTEEDSEEAIQKCEEKERQILEKTLKNKEEETVKYQRGLRQIYNSIWKHRRVLLSEEKEEEKKEKERQIWEEVWKEEEEEEEEVEEKQICEEIGKYLSSGKAEEEKKRQIYEKIWKHEEEKERQICEEIVRYQRGLSLGEKEDKELVRRTLNKFFKPKKLSKEEKVKKEKERQIWEEIWKRQKELFLVFDEEEKKKGENEIYEMLWNHQKQYLSEEEKAKKIKERQTYLEMRQKAIDNPLDEVLFFPYGPGCVMPNFADKGEGLYELRCRMEEERGIKPGIPNLPSMPPLPWDNRQTVPLTPDFAQQFHQQLARGTTVSPVVISREKREKLAAEGRCLDGSYLTPYCKCDDASHSQCGGFKPTYPPNFAPFWLAYHRQIRQSHCFDIDDHPASSFGASVGPLAPSHDFNGKAELLLELANRAILEYNEKECNVFKYKILKIEKVNCSVTAYHQYWMTVKVLNLTLGTPTETFQVHAGKSILNDGDKVIYCCRPKEEAIAGLPSCELCFGLLHREEAT